MKSRWCTSAMTGVCLLLATLLAGFAETVAADQPPTPQVLVISGPCQHPPGTHEAAAGARLMAHLVNHTKDARPLRAQVIDGWPEDKRLLAGAKAIVFIGDIFPPERMENPARVKAELATLMDRGCGLVCIHYATGLRAAHVAEDGDHPLLRWLGGYFATGCPHHRSIARVCTATVEPTDIDHPVLRGWQSFTFDDEPYWNNFFGKDGPAANVTPLATSLLPADNPKKEIIGWAVARPDGGRGVGIVLPHYFRNWQVDDLRMFVLNSVVWSAQGNVPPAGVASTLPELSTFEPDSVEPQPRKKR